MQASKPHLSDLWLSEIHDDAFGCTHRVLKTLFHGQSEYQTVDVVETAFYGTMLLLDGKIMTTERDEYIYHELISHIPLLAHPEPQKVLVIGGGDGGTVREVLKHPSVEEVTLCEIDGLVIEVCEKHLPTIARDIRDERVNLQIGDGIRYIREHKSEYDVIIIDSADPIGPGEGLFTTEFYQDVYDALKADGIMINQSESPWSMPEAVTKIYTMLNKVFPIVHPYTATIPTYPGSIWSWGFCSKKYSPEIADMTRANILAKDCKYFNPQVYNAVFAIPNDQQKLFKEAGVSPYTSQSAEGIPC